MVKLLIIATLLFYGMSLMAEENLFGNRTPCTEKTLAGTYKLLELSEVPLGREATWFRNTPYHYLAFYPEHNYSFVALNQEAAAPEEVIKALQWPKRNNHALNYALDKGILTLTNDGKIDYSYRCLVIKEAQGLTKKGDLVLMGYTKDRTQIYKLYRLWF